MRIARLSLFQPYMGSDSLMGRLSVGPDEIDFWMNQLSGLF